MDARGGGMRGVPEPARSQPASTAPDGQMLADDGEEAENRLAAPVAVSYNRSIGPSSDGSVRSRRLSAARRASVPGQRRPSHTQPPPGGPGVSTTATRTRAPLEGHPAVPKPDDDDLPPSDDDAHLVPRRARAHLDTPLPLEYLREQAEAITDIGVPGHLLAADPPNEFLDLDSVQALLSEQTRPLPIRDAAWRYLIANAVEHRGRWYVYLFGLVARRLTERAHWLTPGGEGGDRDDKREVQQHLAVGFLAELYNVRPDDERIGERIIWRTVYRAKQAWWHNQEPTWPRLPGEPEPPPEPPADDAPPADDDLAPVLRALVLATADVHPSRSDRRPKLSAEDATLLALCTLYGRTVPEAAQEIGISADAARSKLPRIKRAVFTLLASTYLRHKHPRWSLRPTGDAGRQ
jgi:hypothetical protein